MDGLAPEQRLEYWLEMVCSTYVQLECEPPPDQPIFGDIEFSRIGDVQFTHLKSNGRRVWRTAQRIRTSNEDYCLVLLQREGRAVVRQDGRIAVVNPGTSCSTTARGPMSCCSTSRGTTSPCCAWRARRSRTMWAISRS